MAIIEDLLVAERGAYIGLHGQRLRVEVKAAKPQDAPLLHLQSVQVLTRSASISAAALAACCEAGVPVHFVDAFEGNYATVFSSKLTTVVTTRRCQLEAAYTPIGLGVARRLAQGKLYSQAQNLRYIARRQAEAAAHELKQVALDLQAYADELAGLAATTVDDLRQALMGYEGHGARRYWAALGLLVPSEYAWAARETRGATDPVNVLLNYGYGILYGEVQKSLLLAGLEPYAGLIHTDRPGKPSLTCDLIEEFRAPVVDRTVIGLVNRQYQVGWNEQGRLDEATRKGFAEHILNRLKAQGSYEGKRYSLRAIIQLQARRLAAAFRGEREYEAYTGG
jgi:CRISPR-associated protein Cas1